MHARAAIYAVTRGTQHSTLNSQTVAHINIAAGIEPGVEESMPCLDDYFARAYSTADAATTYRLPIRLVTQLRMPDLDCRPSSSTEL